MDRNRLREVLEEMRLERVSGGNRHKCAMLPEPVRSEFCARLLAGEEYRPLATWLRTKVSNPPALSSVARFGAELLSRMHEGEELRLGRIAKAMQDNGVVGVLRLMRSGDLEIELRPSKAV